MLPKLQFTRRRHVVALATLGVLAMASPALAVKFWKNSVPSGNWSVSNSWSATAPSGTDFTSLPGLNEPVRIYNTNSTAHTVTYDVNAPALGLLVVDLPSAGAATNTLSIVSNNSLTAAGIYIGGHNGVGGTTGRGAIVQSAGSVATSAATDMYLGVAPGSSGSYTLSGGSLTASLSEAIGGSGTGTFNHSGGTNTLVAEAIGGAFFLGYAPGSSGTYNLSGTGQLISNKHEYVGLDGAGFFSQTAGSNTITGPSNLYIGLNAGAQGTYSISGGTLTAGYNVQVGGAGSGNLNISGSGSVYVTNELGISNTGIVNLTGGTLRFSTISQVSRLNWQSGTLQLAGDRNLNTDSTLSYYFGFEPTIGVGRKVVVEGASTLGPSLNFSVSGGAFTSLGTMTIGIDNSAINTVNFTNGATVVTSNTRLAVRSFGNSQNPRAIVNVSGAGTSWNTGFLEVGRGGVATVNITGGAAVVSSEIAIGVVDALVADSNVVVVSGPGSSLTSNASLSVGAGGIGTLTIDNGALVYAATELHIDAYSAVNLRGGTLRFNTFSRVDLSPTVRGEFYYTGGTVQLAGARTIGGDAMIQELYGTLPVIPTGKGLTVEGAATLTRPLTIAGGTFKANSLAIGSGGLLDFDRGVLELTGGALTGVPQLNLPTNGELRASGTQTLRVVGAAGSTITATGNLLIGNNTAVNGFATQGTLNVGANLVSLFDANDAVLDSTSFTTLGANGSPGTLDSFYGLTLNFGGNITGYGTISTLGDITTPLINNGHIIGNSASQRITLPGYVKGAGTFDNVTFTGTFAPGLSPTISVVGNVGFASTSTLQIEVGGFAPGSQHDQVLATGTLSLAGTLNVTAINGFQILPGDEFTVLKFASRTGDFSSVVFSGNTYAGLRLTRVFTANSMIIKGDGLKGDADLNGTVNFDDLLAVAQHYNTGGANWFTGDFDRSGTVGFDDLLALAQAYGTSLSLVDGAFVDGASAEFNADWQLARSLVPEPGVAALALSLSGLLQRRRAQAVRRWA